MFKRIKWRLFRKIEENDITYDELKLKQNEGAIIIDVRSAREFEENNIKGSINIPEYEIDRKIERILNNKNAVIVVYCASGSRSRKAYNKLKKLGYFNVYNLYGGLDNY